MSLTDNRLTPDEYEAALRRAFVEHHADFVVITSRREQFQIEATNYGIDQGWFTGEMDTRDEQSSAWVCRLTDKGREHFGVKVL
jgi:uncharacterized protein YbdZ (MbtH family)